MSNFVRDQVKKIYQNLKSSAKSKIAENAKSRNQTGGGLHISKTLTEAERQLEDSLGQSKGFIGEKFFVESRIFPRTESFNQNQSSDTISERNSILNFMNSTVIDDEVYTILIYLADDPLFLE